MWLTVIPVLALKSATTESGRYSPHIKTFTTGAAKAFGIYQGPIAAAAPVAAAPFRTDLLETFAALRVLFIFFTATPHIVN